MSRKKYLPLCASTLGAQIGQSLCADFSRNCCIFLRKEVGNAEIEMYTMNNTTIHIARVLAMSLGRNSGSTFYSSTNILTGNYDRFTAIFLRALRQSDSQPVVCAKVLRMMTNRLWLAKCIKTSGSVSRSLALSNDWVINWRISCAFEWHFTPLLLRAATDVFDLETAQ